MDQKKIARINELYKKSKVEKLSEEELEEQSALRSEYRMSIIQNLTGSLDNVRIKNPDGSIVKPKRKGH